MKLSKGFTLISTRSQVFTHFGVQSSALGMGFQSAALDSKIPENSWFSTYQANQEAIMQAK